MSCKDSCNIILLFFSRFFGVSLPYPSQAQSHNTVDTWWRGSSLSQGPDCVVCASRGFSASATQLTMLVQSQFKRTETASTTSSSARVSQWLFFNAQFASFDTDNSTLIVGLRYSSKPLGHRQSAPGDTAVGRSRSSRINLTLIRKCSENTSGNWSEGWTVGRGEALVRDKSLLLTWYNCLLLLHSVIVEHKYFDLASCTICESARLAAK